MTDDHDRNVRLWEAWQAGDESAREALILANRDQVIHAAWAIARNQGIDRAEAASAAVVTLIEAVGRWEPDKGTLRASFRFQLKRAVYAMRALNTPISIPPAYWDHHPSQWGGRSGERLRAEVQRPRDEPDWAPGRSAEHTKAELSEVSEMLGRLSPTTALYLRLHFYEDVGLPAIAARLGHNERTVQRYVKAGLGELRRMAEGVA